MSAKQTVQASFVQREHDSLGQTDNNGAHIHAMENSPSTNGQRKRANALDGKTWLRYSISVWSDITKSPEEMQLGHPALFPITLASRLIEIFTNDHDHIIFDPFAGVGSTIIAAQQLGKHGIGIELSPHYARIATLRCQQLVLFGESSVQGIIHPANALHLDEYVAEQSVDLVITSPPYWDILNQKRTADNKDIRHYGNTEDDLGTISDYQDFLTHLRAIFVEVYNVMRHRAYCCVIVMDLRKKDRFYPFHSDVADMMQTIGFVYDDLIIWDRRHEYNNMRPLGYPSVFRVNKAHEFILIFQKP